MQEERKHVFLMIAVVKCRRAK